MYNDPRGVEQRWEHVHINAKYYLVNGRVPHRVCRKDRPRWALNEIINKCGNTFISMWGTTNKSPVIISDMLAQRFSHNVPCWPTKTVGPVLLTLWKDAQAQGHDTLRTHRLGSYKMCMRKRDGSVLLPFPPHYHSLFSKAILHYNRFTTLNSILGLWLYAHTFYICIRSLHFPFESRLVVFWHRSRRPWIWSRNDGRSSAPRAPSGRRSQHCSAIRWSALTEWLHATGWNTERLSLLP